MSISRRGFVKTLASTGAGVAIVPRHVLGRGQTAPSDRLNIAGVGVGGMGKINLLNLALHNNLVALCDVDWDYAGRAWDSLASDLKREQERLPTVTDPVARGRSVERIDSLEKTSTPWWSPPPITCTPSSPWRPWTSANTSTCRSP
jgi:hypothetical protein